MLLLAVVGAVVAVGIVIFVAAIVLLMFFLLPVNDKQQSATATATTTTTTGPSAATATAVTHCSLSNMAVLLRFNSSSCSRSNWETQSFYRCHSKLVWEARDHIGYGDDGTLSCKEVYFVYIIFVVAVADATEMVVCRSCKEVDVLNACDVAVVVPILLL